MSGTLTNADSDLQNISIKNLPGQIIVFSHLRWDFVYQRPQHLLTRFARSSQVYFIEEPIFDAAETPYYHISDRDANVKVLVPHLIPGLSHQFTISYLNSLLKNLLLEKDLTDTCFWYYTPMALEFSRQFEPAVIVFDCMDELSAFKFAPEELKTLELELMQKADVVFTGGESLYQAKKDRHQNIHAFPSSIETDHFNKARQLTSSPADQPDNEKATLGFYGVIDERFDIDLIRGMADAKPDWDIVLIGPVVKIDPATLPRNNNIHYLGSRSYQELPLYMATWDIALIPFLLNESTRFISPTKTPEYLAAGLPVISTPITDVVNPYGDNKLVEIGNDANDFVTAAEKLLQRPETVTKDWLKEVDVFLKQNSWDITAAKMANQINKVTAQKSSPLTSRQYV